MFNPQPITHTAPTAVGQVINLGTGSTVSIGDLAQTIIAFMGQPKNIVSTAERSRPRASEVWHLESDNRKARELLGWQPQTPLKDGLTQTIDYIRTHLDSYKPGIYNL